MPRSLNPMNLDDVKQMIRQHTENVISKIEKRSDSLEETVSKVTPVFTIIEKRPVQR
jgi:hypothetical protein